MTVIETETVRVSGVSIGLLIKDLTRIAKNSGPEADVYCYENELEISWERPETEQETADRLLRDQRREDILRNTELLELKRLKEKYETAS